MGADQKGKLPMWRRSLRALLVVKPMLTPVAGASGLRWTAEWPSWRPRNGWWVLECPPCASGLGAVLLLEELDSTNAMTVASRGVSKRIVRFTGRGQLRVSVIPSVPGMRPDPQPVFSQATAGYACVRMRTKIGRLAARGMVPLKTAAGLESASVETLWRIYDTCMVRGSSGRIDPTEVADEMALRSDVLSALAEDAEARLEAVHRRG